MSELRNIVIIGASVAGSVLSRALESKLPLTHRIVLIDSNEFAFFPPASLRAAVVPGWEDKPFRSLAAFFPKSSRHVVLPLTKVVGLGKGYIEVDRDVSDALGGAAGQKIDFEVCVLGLGATYCWPFRATSNRLGAAVETMVEGQKKLEACKTVVIVGGGPVGIEYAGEILDIHPNMSITLIQGTNRLLADPWPTSFSDKLHTELTQKGVTIVLGQRVPAEVANAGKGKVELKDGRTVDAGLIINAGGISPNTELIKLVDPGALNAKGYITVSPTLRVLSSDPASPLVTSTYFASGDCADSPGGQTGFKAGTEAAALAKNILALLSGQPIAPVAPPPQIMVVTLGSNGGFASFPYIGVWGRRVSRLLKDKKLFTDDLAKRYPVAA